MKLEYFAKSYFTNFNNNYEKGDRFYQTNGMITDVTIKPTLKCTSKCTHCEGRKKNFNRARELTISEYKTIFSYLKREGLQEVCISGGEPLLYNNLDKLIKIITNEGLICTLNTNGYLLTAKVLDKLINNGLMGINLSLDSPKEIVHDNLRNHKGLYRAIMNNIKSHSKIKEKYIFNIRMILSKFNYKDVDKMIKLGNEIGAHSLSIDMIENDFENKDFLLNKHEILDFKENMIPKLKTAIKNFHMKDNLLKENIKQIEALYDLDFNNIENYENGKFWPNQQIKNKCAIPEHFMIIEGDGNVLPCNAIEYNREFIVGNCKEAGIDTIIKSNARQKFIEEKAEICQRCPMNMSYKLILDDTAIERDLSTI